MGPLDCTTGVIFEHLAGCAAFAFAFANAR